MEAIKEKLALYREYLRGLILVILTLISALVIGFYNVLIKKAPLYSIWFLSFGFIILIVLLLILKFLNNKILDGIKELDNGTSCSS